jgi:hypothetical protein
MNAREEILAIFRDLRFADLDVEEVPSTGTSALEIVGEDLGLPEAFVAGEPETRPFISSADTTETALRISGDPTPSSEFELFESFSGEPRGDVLVLDSHLTDPVSQQQVRAAIEAILEVESPIQIDRLLSLLAGLFSLERIKKARRDSMIVAVPEQLIHKDPIGEFVWSSPNEWETWDRFRLGTANSSRSAAEICSIEYRNALVEFLRRQRVLSHEDAVRELATAFGFSRLGPNVRAAIEQSIVEALTKGIIEQSGDSYSLPNL